MLRLVRSFVVVFVRSFLAEQRHVTDYWPPRLSLLRPFGPDRVFDNQSIVWLGLFKKLRDSSDYGDRKRLRRDRIGVYAMATKAAFKRVSEKDRQRQPTAGVRERVRE